MSVDRIVHIFAGTLVLISVGLSLWISPYCLILAAFVGANLFQSGVTRWCLMSSLLRRFGVKDDGAAA